MESSGSQNNTLPSTHILLAKMSHMTNPIARKSGRDGGVQRLSWALMVPSVPYCHVVPMQALKTMPVASPNTLKCSDTRGEMAFHPATAPLTWLPFSSATLALNLFSVLMMFSGADAVGFASRSPFPFLWQQRLNIPLGHHPTPTPVYMQKEVKS